MGNILQRPLERWSSRKQSRLCDESTTCFCREEYDDDDDTRIIILTNMMTFWVRSFRWGSRQCSACLASDKYSLKFGEIYFTIYTNMFYNLMKYILPFYKIRFIIWLNTFYNFYEELEMRFQAVLYCLICLLSLRQKHFKIWRNKSYNLHKYLIRYILQFLRSLRWGSRQCSDLPAFAGSALLAWPETNTFKIFGEIYLTI